jgi:hypothetical protein
MKQLRKNSCIVGKGKGYINVLEFIKRPSGAVIILYSSYLVFPQIKYPFLEIWVLRV